MIEGWHLCLQVIEDVSLDTAFLLAELRPPEHRQTERYRRGVECIDLASELEDVCCPFLPGLRHHVEGKLLKDTKVAVLIGRSQRRLGDGLSSQAEVEALGPMGFYSHYHIAQTLTVTELAEHQSKKLVPAGEMLDITIPVILVNKVAELVIV